MDEKTMKRLIQAAGILTTGAGGLTVAAFMNIYDKVFSRYERPDYSLYPGLYDYERVKDVLPREIISYPSNNVTLCGYYYEKKNPKGLVVTCHGIHSGADDYIPVQKYFYDYGYSVFSFDYKGTYSSGGDSTVGMCESLVDLDNTLDFLESDERFKNLPLFLFGHSWGGYAVLSVLCKRKNIKAVAAISPMNDGYTMINEKAEQYAGLASKGTKPYLDVYQKYLFRKYTEYNAVKGINSTDIPVFVAHGVEDKVIDYFTQSVYSHRNEIINHNVIWYTGYGFHGDHDDIWHSFDSINYRKELSSKLKVFKNNLGRDPLDEELRGFYSDADHRLYSEVDEHLMSQILSVFDYAVRK